MSKLIEISLPLPDYFTYNSVNIFLIKEEPITLIDTGPFTEKVLLLLKEKLGHYAIQLSDIKRIFLTHGHVDHTGIAGFLEEKYQCEVYIHYKDFKKLTLNNKDKLKFKKQTLGKLLEKYKFDKNIIEKLTFFFKDFYKFNWKLKNPAKIINKKLWEFEKSTLKVIELPGHTAGSVGYLYNDHNLILGDSLLNTTFVTPILEFDEKFNSYKNLKNYYLTLKKLKQFKNINIYPGHGNGNFDLEKKTNEILNYIEKKALEIKNKIDFSKTLKENFYCLFNTSPEKFFFHFSFFYGLLEFLEMELLFNE